ncbi:hypothetical protein BJV74DRAFT_818293 [Russula compacta]|nr:hypothetical protein BJV74DRAFT_818293 [Russula compacta]
MSLLRLPRGKDTYVNQRLQTWDWEFGTTGTPYYLVILKCWRSPHYDLLQIQY